MSTENTFRLKNGLRVLIQESHAAPVVSIQVWINVGSADERPEEAGIAHQLEHMLFKGTDRRGVGEIARSVEGAGGEINAFTSFDNTVYYVTMASRHFELGLDVLADAVQNARIDAEELRMEKEVVLEEVRRYEDTPSRQLDQAVFTAVFRTHPYGRPVIGFEETVRGFERDDVVGFYRRWYTPDNMIVVIVGDVDAREAERAVRARFESFARPPAPRRSRPQEPAQTGPRTTHVEKAVQEAMIELAFPIPAVSHPDAPLLDLLALILGQGESSRLTERVKNQKQLVNSVYAFAYTPLEPGVFLVGAALEPSRIMETYDALLEEVRLVRQAPVRGSELRKAQSIIRSDRVYERETVDGRARKFGYYLSTFGTLDAEKAYYRAVEEATVADILRVAQTYFDPDRVTIATLMPRGARVPDDDELTTRAHRALHNGTPPAPQLVGRREQETRKIVLPNGIRLLIRENHSVPLVAVRAAFEGGLRHETRDNNGIFQLMSQLLTRGTPNRNAFEIAHEVESLACSVGGFSGRNSFGLRAEFLSQHLERGLELFSEILHGPSFAEDELAKVRRTTLEALRNLEDHPSTYVFRIFSETLYRRHPFRMSSLGNERALNKMTPRRLRRMFDRHVTADNMVLSVVGDVDPQDMEMLARRYFGDFNTGGPLPDTVPEEPPLTRRRVRLRSSDKHQLHLVLGWRGASVTHPDRYVLQLLSSILAGQGGRLFLELRDRQGLAYTVTSVSMEALGEGYFAIYMATEPSKFDRAHRGILEVVSRLLQDGVDDAELDRAKRYLVGSYEIDLQRSAALCANLAFNELYGLGHDSYQKYAARIDAITREEILEAARRYLDPRVYVLAGLGPTGD